MRYGSRIPEEYRRKVSYRIRRTMSPHIREAKSMNSEFEAAGEALEVSTVAVRAWYEGISLPTIYNLVRWADLYDVSLDYILGRKIAGEIKKAA